MPIISGGGGGGGATPALDAVLTVGNDADSTGIDNLGDTTLDGDIITGGNRVAGTSSGDAPALAIEGALAGNSVLRGGSPGAATSGGRVTLEGGAGDNFSSNGAFILVGGGNGDGVTHGRLRVITNNSGGAAGQAIVSDGANYTVFGGVRVAAGVPAAAPDGVLPFAYDTTAATGGFYFWNGAAWVKIATIL